ncbi:MAG TPA: DUF885 domain-containing protein [Candidatus Saccharimonadaceae bacterium]|jgi:uncharacterized protein (DUF885 family)|nr:DUF885 domain-containing protein [Candidatus Saccharimonadaceae bacterium]
MLETVRALTALSEEYVEVTLRQDPVAATRAGLHDYDEQLPDDSPEGLRARAAWLRDLDQRLVASVPWEELPIEPRVDYALMRSLIAADRADLEEIKVHSRNPVMYPQTALEGIFLLVARDFAPLEERKEAILARLMNIPEYLERAALNLRQPPEMFVRIAGEVNLSGPQYVDEVVRMLLRHFPGEAERIEHAGERARSGFLQYQEFMDRDLRPQATGSVALGERWMNFRLERQHLLSMDCAYLEAFGREHVALGRAHLEQQAARLDATRGWREQLSDAGKRHPEPLHLNEAYEAEVERARRFVEEHHLAPIAPGALRVIETPPFDRVTMPLAWYRAPSAFDEEPMGLLTVTPADPGRPREEQQLQLEAHHYAALPLIVAHESFPGHHLQRCQARLHGSRLRRMTSSDLFSDGWALYAERLMHDHGFFIEPVSRLVHLWHVLWRACRVVVDIGLHSGRMSVDQAEAYLVSEAGLDPISATAEVKRYALHPGQPLGYLVGLQLIESIRDEARTRLGADFDLYDFHAELLRIGTLPPFLIREELGGRLTTR